MELSQRQSAFENIRSRLFFVLFAMFIFRLGSHVPIPGVDLVKLGNYFSENRAGFMGFINMFGGGALSRMSVFSLGVGPYISASIAVNLLSFVIPTLEQYRKQGSQGQHQLTRYTRMLALVVALAQSIPVAKQLVAWGFVLNPSPSFYLLTCLSLATGTFFLMWLGEQITERGIGNGISVLIFAGIVSRFPEGLSSLTDLYYRNQMNGISLLLILAAILSVTAIVVWIEKGQRQIKITHPSRMQTGSSNVLPLKINMAGVIPPIFASIIVFTPLNIAALFTSVQDSPFLLMATRLMQPGQVLYSIIVVAAIAFFAFAYTSVTFNPEDLAENLKKGGAMVPGIRPGKSTAKYIDDVMSRLTLFGIIYLSFIVLLPEIFVQIWKIPFYFGGTSLLIVVVVVMDFMSQLNAHLIPDRYHAMVSKKKDGKKQNLQLFR
jgi:preprotein translocase subunit SecY